MASKQKKSSRRRRRPTRVEVEDWLKLPSTQEHLKKIMADCRRKQLKRRRQNALTPADLQKRITI